MTTTHAPNERTMKAIVFDVCGSSEVLELRDIEVPVVKDDEVLVRICAAAATRCPCRRGR